MPTNPKEVNVPASLRVTGMKATKLEYQAIEDEEEKALRLRKDSLSFYFKELSVWILAPLFIVIAWCVCLWILISGGFSATEKEWARTVFMAITSGAVGVFFGKQIGK
jgi:hypothetical protein